MPDRDLIIDHFEFNSAYYVQSRNASRANTYNEDYKYEEDIYAAYGMFEHHMNKLMILGGLRFERTDITRNDGFNVRTQRIIQDGVPRTVTIVDSLSSPRTEDYWLPQLQLRYTLTPQVNLRAAVTRTYARPNYDDIIAAREEDESDEISIGNDGVQFPTATNLDFLVERFAGKSIFSAGVFYKKIDNFIYSFAGLLRDEQLVDPNNPNDVISTTEVSYAFNGTEATVFGAEFQAQLKFDFLSNARLNAGFLNIDLSNFGVYANYTYTNSEAFIPERPSANLVDAPLVPFTTEGLTAYFSSSDQSTKISLPGQAEHTFNFALFYDGPKLFARLSTNYQDAFLTAIGLDPDYDEFYDEAFRLDYTMNYQLNENVTFFTDWINITNTPLRFYLGSDESIVKQQEFYSWWCRFGARINL